jgi:hypothetical protein
LVFISAVNSVSPVMFAPGRAKLFTTPPLTGSPTAPRTMGIVVVACFAARAAGKPSVTSKDLRRTALPDGRGGSRGDNARPER